MEYIVEYEVIDTKYCAIVKNPYSGAPAYITDFFNTQSEAAEKVKQFIDSNTLTAPVEPPKAVSTGGRKPCCGRN